MKNGKKGTKFEGNYQAKELSAIDALKAKYEQHDTVKIAQTNTFESIETTPTDLSNLSKYPFNKSKNNPYNEKLP